MKNALVWFVLITVVMFAGCAQPRYVVNAIVETQATPESQPIIVGRIQCQIVGR